MEQGKYLEVAKEAALAGGRILLEGRARHAEATISLKGFGDWITDVDHRAEQAVIRSIRSRFPGHRIHAEESGRSETPSDFEWIIDPLDGTANFVKNIPVITVSVALTRAGRSHTGVVYDPVHQELFWAQAGAGAFLNGHPIHCAADAGLDTAIIATGFPWRSKAYIREYLEAFGRILERTAGARRMGSAALDLAYTACGRFDGFWEMKLKPWDVAAGLLLVREAGGIVTDFRGEDTFPESGNIVAAPPSIHQFLLSVSRETLGEIPGNDAAHADPARA